MLLLSTLKRTVVTDERATVLVGSGPTSQLRKKDLEFSRVCHAIMIHNVLLFIRMLEIVAPAVSEAALNYMATSLLSFFSSQQSLESSLLENVWDTNLNFLFS